MIALARPRRRPSGCEDVAEVGLPVLAVGLHTRRSATRTGAAKSDNGQGMCMGFCRRKALPALWRSG
eukprot:4067646-Prymnesium_polylepis.1